jgi:hypothetical protein
MDKPVLIIEVPELNDDAATIVLDFLQDILNAFDSHVYYQRQRNKQLLHCASCRNKSSEEEDPLF